MTDTPPPSFPDRDPVNKRRSSADEEQVKTVTFTQKGMPPERLEALKRFLKSASADELASIRKLYGEMPEVLQMIGLEIMPPTTRAASKDKSDI